MKARGAEIRLARGWLARKRMSGGRVVDSDYEDVWTKFPLLSVKGRLTNLDELHTLPLIWLCPSG
jgi:hypothetical protein